MLDFNTLIKRSSAFSHCLSCPLIYLLLNYYFSSVRLFFPFKCHFPNSDVLPTRYTQPQLDSLQVKLWPITALICDLGSCFFYRANSWLGATLLNYKHKLRIHICFLPVLFLLYLSAMLHRIFELLMAWLGSYRSICYH